MRYVLATALAVMLALPVAAQDFQKGFEAYQRGEYATALSEWRPLAEQGDAATQNNLGVMYEIGQGVAQDYAEAVKWYREAAEQGHANAQFNLSVLYNIGEGVSEDHAEALNWTRKAAGQGHAQAQLCLGMIYAGLGGICGNPNISDEEIIIATVFGELREYAGLGVPPDYVEAARWIRRAAEQGLVEAQRFLANMYVAGQGVPQDDAEAEKWNRKVAIQEGTEPQFNFRLGGKYAKGQGVPQDNAEAMRWYRKSAEQGYAGAQYTLGVIYHTGKTVPRNDVEAYKWYELAAAQGHDGAAVNRDLVLAKEMTPEQIAKAQRLAREWLEKHGKAE